MASPTLRWGVLSAGKISGSLCSAIATLPDTENKVVAVAARAKADAETFATKFGIPKAYGSYHDLVQDPDVDVVYIGSVNSEHFRLCKLALNAGKHVLCEKPLCINAREATEVVTLAKEKGKFFMEGFWTRCFPAVAKLRDTLSSGVIGDVRLIQASFGAVIAHKARISQKEMGGGGLLDLGCYCIQLSDMVFGGKPEKVVATGTLEKSGVDDTVSLTLQYPDNKMAAITSSISCKLNNTAIIYGTKGRIELPDLWCPTSITTPEGSFDFPLPGKIPTEGAYFYKDEGLIYEIVHVRDTILSGGLESPLVPHTSSLAVMAILDEARKQLGVVFPPDTAPTKPTHR